VRLGCAKAALRAYGGNVSAAARALGMTSEAVDQMIAQIKGLRDVIEVTRKRDEREVDAKILEACKRGDPVMLRIYARSKVAAFRDEGPRPNPEIKILHQQAAPLEINGNSSSAHIDGEAKRSAASKTASCTREMPHENLSPRPRTTPGPNSSPGPNPNINRR
jgi:hypothetical protein